MLVPSVRGSPIASSPILTSKMDFLSGLGRGHRWLGMANQLKANFFLDPCIQPGRAGWMIFKSAMACRPPPRQAERKLLDRLGGAYL